MDELPEELQLIFNGLKQVSNLMEINKRLITEAKTGNIDPDLINELEGCVNELC